MNRYSTESGSLSIQFGRLSTFLIVVLAWGLVLALRLGQLQLVRGDEYRVQAEQQQFGFIEVSPKRGDILDRQLEPLAVSVQMDSVFAHPREVDNPVDTARLLSPILQAHSQEIYKKLISERSFVYIARRITPRQAQQIRALGLKGIYMHQETQRVYPGGELAAHVLGFVGTDNEGLSGLEYLYDDLIKGEKKRIQLRVDARRQSFERDAPAAQTNGHTVVLNIDRSLQFMASQVLQETIQAHKAVNGSAIIMNPHSGEVLALASYPAFNPNRYFDYDPEIRRNRAILEIYEPGSTFKLVTLSAVLAEGLARPDEVIDCRVGTLRLAGKVYREAKHSYGMLDFRGILAKSSNVGTIKLGLRLGEEQLYSYIRRYGFGEKTGIELPGEQTGLLRPPSQWSKLSIGAISIGQELGVTPMQMIRAISVVANGGFLIKPRLVRQILTAEGDVVDRDQPVRERVLPQAAADEMRTALSQVVLEGTGKTARLDGYSSAGKTGTAQKFINGQYSRSKYVSSYVGFAPVDKPALAAIVVINEPGTGQYYGGLVAAPAFKQLMERALLHLKVPQDQPMGLQFAGTMSEHTEEDTLAASAVAEPVSLDELEGALSTLLNNRTEAVENSEHVVTLDTGFARLPDFRGQSLRQVVQACTRLGLRLKVTGSGRAVGQRPLPGTPVLRDSVCEVFFTTEGNPNHAAQTVALENRGGRAAQAAH